MVTLKCHFPVLLAAHTVIPVALGPSRDGVGGARVGAPGALHAVTARVCSCLRKTSRAQQALADALRQEIGMALASLPIQSHTVPFPAKLDSAWSWKRGRVAKGDQGGLRAALFQSPARLSSSSCPAQVQATQQQPHRCWSPLPSPAPVLSSSPSRVILFQ